MEEQPKYFILWTTTLRSVSLIKYIVHLHNAQLWCPTFKITNMAGQVEEVQIYPSYYFIYTTYSCCQEMKEYINAHRYKGMFFLEQDDKLAHLRQFEIEQIKYIEETYTMDKFLNINPGIQIGKTVKIIAGPFTGIKGEVINIKNTEVLLDISDKGTKLWCSIDNVQKAGK